MPSEAVPSSHQASTENADGAGTLTPAPTPALAPAPARSAPVSGRLRGIRTLLPGLGVCAAVAVVATIAGREVPVIGGPVFGILMGILMSSVLRARSTVRTEALLPGYAFASKKVLQTSIVVLGTGLSLREVVHTGGGSLPVMLGTLAVALGGAWLLGRLLKVDPETTLLIGTGTGICGASAIAAVTAVAHPKKEHVAYAMGTIFTFNVAAVLAFPAIGHLLGLSQQALGLWAGTAINDTSSVVAAAYAFGAAAGDHAIVVKLTRTLMIIPICLAIQWWYARRHPSLDARRPWWNMVPAFIIGFLVASALTTIGVIPQAWHPALAAIGTFMITVALAAIGLSLRLADMRKAGHRPLLLGGILWAAVAVSSLGLQALTGLL